MVNGKRFPTGREGKAYWFGTHRIVHPDETWARISPYLQQMGISRVANITGLDNVGIPVALAIRPNSRSLASSQGKGQTLIAAKVSAAMEAAETFHAERINFRAIRRSHRQMMAESRCVDVERLPKARSNIFRENLVIAWIAGEVWPTGDTIMVPLEVVSTDYTVGQPDNVQYFSATTNGLASGNSLTEAVSHALYEVIERDAITTWRLSGAAQREECGVRLDTIRSTACREMIEKFHAAGLDLRVWNITTDVGLPSFYALAVEKKPDGLEIEVGSGCHPNKEVALSRALTEVAQSRLTRIAGSRDDLNPQLIGPLGRRHRGRRAHLVPRSAEAVCYGDIPSSLANDITSELAETCRRLSTVGVDEITVVDLTREEFGIPVVKVIVPALEPPLITRASNHQHGRRVAAAVDLP